MQSAAEIYDVVIVGGGPAGAACAGFCARAGLRVVVVERAIFPRDKVCGDCLNPACWPVLERLGVDAAVRRLPHARLREVEFVGLRGRTIRLPLPDDSFLGEIAVRRRELDALLLDHAANSGAEVRFGRAVEPDEIKAPFVVAADGRNSVTARRAGLLTVAAGGAMARIGLQTHLPCPSGFGDRVQMRWFAEGYGGLCPVGDGQLNISLAAPPGSIERLKGWAHAEFSLPADHPWLTIAPIDRAPAARVVSADGRVLLIGDAARVVEPFTGEGIYYALRSGELAAEAIVSGDVQTYAAKSAAMYRGRLWANRLARAAGRNPRVASWALGVLRWRPELLRYLTAKVVG